MPSIEASEAKAAALIDQGNSLEDAGRLAEALALYQEAVTLAPSAARAHLNVGNALLRRGEFDAALRAYETAVNRDPGYAPAHYNLGNALARLDRREDALLAYERSLALKPDFVEAEVAMGCVLDDLDRRQDALTHFRRALDLDPRHAACMSLLAAALARDGRVDEAVERYRELLRVDPGSAANHFQLANVLMEAGHSSAAAESYRKAIEIEPQFALAHAHLGFALKKLSRPDDAIASFRRATQIDPTSADAHINLGAALSERGLHEEAIHSFRSAISSRPEFPNAHHNLGVELCAVGRSVDALAAFRKALELDPGVAHTHTSLGNALADCGLIEEAVASHRRAIAADPGLAEAHHNLGNALRDLGRLNDALQSYRRALAIKPDYPAVQSNILFVLNCASGSQPSTRIAEARRFGDMLDRRDMKRFDTWLCEPDPQRLRIGMVSGDLRSHPVGYFLQGLLSEVDESRVELFAYPTFDRHDDVAAALKRGFHGWKPLSGMSDSAAAEAIRDDGIHVLIDLAGHTAHNRLEVFGCKPAPVQASWLGYCGTTGVTQMDYVIGDRCVTPEREMHHFTERVWQMSGSYLCFSPPTAAPDVAPLPALSAGRVTFGCFNNLSKMSDEVVALWSRLLHAVPRSRLMLKAHQLGDSSMREATLSRFASRGIEADRLLLQGFSSRSDYFAAYGLVDIALDPFPYPGATTTVDGYWMGVPAVTKRGDRFLAHNAETIAHGAGLADWIADDDDDYVGKAVTWATRIEELGRLRAGLRARVRASPLCDAKRFARSFETALWGIWRAKRSAPGAPGSLAT